jgi:hypothetical protein
LGSEYQFSLKAHRIVGWVERRETQRVLNFVGFRLTQPNLQLYASLKRLSTQLDAIAPTVQLTFIMLQPIHLVCIDRRTRNVYVLVGSGEYLEFEIVPNGEVF